MKITLVRVSGSNDPAMVILGHPREKIGDVAFFWLIDECCDPNICEYWETNFKPDNFGIIWYGKDQFASRSGNELTYSANEQLTDLFESESGNWKKIEIYF